MSAITGIYEARDPFEELRQFLKSERLAKHALYIATPSLVEETSQWLTSGLCNNGRALSKLAAYAARMAYRATPFGICAAVGLVETGQTTNLAVDTGRWRTRVRPDMGHLLGACTTLPRNERSKIKYVANGAVYRRGGRLYVTHIPHSFVTASEKENAITEQLPVSIKLTAAVTSIVADASEPIEYSILAGKLANRYNSELKAAEEYLDTLIEAGVLISELHLSPVGDPISRLASRLKEISNPIGKKLCKGLQITNEINALPLGDRAESLGGQLK